jgi:3'-phosphoadenosine 5'-phosphosulfate sulfotransferase (PAPS reductase)/FAD synthetase
VNGVDYITLFTGSRDYKDGEQFVCSLKDLLFRPKVPSYEFKWDCIFHGHKQCDSTYISDDIKVPKAKRFGNGIMSFPLQDWTHQNIWDYIEFNNIPYSKERYDGGVDKANNDVVPACHKCLDYRNAGSEIICPKTGTPIKFCGKSEEENIAFRNALEGKAYK